MAPEGAPVAAESKSLFLSERLAAMLLNPSSAALYNFSVLPVSKARPSLGLWSVSYVALNSCVCLMLH